MPLPGLERALNEKCEVKLISLSTKAKLNAPTFVHRDIYHRRRRHRRRRKSTMTSTLGTTTLGVMTFVITAVSIKALFATFSINDTQHYNTLPL
jgi:hypothetical protein